MSPMTTGEIIITAYITVLTAGLGSLFWRQLAEIRAEIGALRIEVPEGDGELRQEIAALRIEMREGDGELRQEIAALRIEMREGDGELRAEIAGLRSDLTQVALAVGARRPHASEG
jgi:hypothetical protein